MFHYYDPLPKTDDVTASVAINECQNCGQACETLIWLEGWNFNACEICAEEAAREELVELRKPAHSVVAYTPEDAEFGNDELLEVR